MGRFLLSFPRDLLKRRTRFSPVCTNIFTGTVLGTKQYSLKVAKIDVCVREIDLSTFDVSFFCITRTMPGATVQRSAEIHSFDKSGGTESRALFVLTAGTRQMV